ncbi:uncharacterized protein EI90DRAFT_2936129 [Cantharellus anzutake]|uniref:uncharacterized protein n=1 Tax=Cantharellus anzutake TaxID=1750568 RepID=UPI001905F905|nr:uncharacterized protein EI90DRAFT_2936129 [Cantharellus anzutake]KAF8322940.1 hypothetical protein EI90DRAFT_2936129 [Cantharellus anzutake]
MCLSAPPSDYPGVNDFAQKAKENLMAAHDMIIHNHTAQTIQANKKRHLNLPLRKGEFAYLSMDKLNLPKGRAGKLKPLYIGPYEILETFPETLLWGQVRAGQTNTYHTFHPLLHQGLGLVSRGNNRSCRDCGGGSDESKIVGFGGVVRPPYLLSDVPQSLTHDLQYSSTSIIPLSLFRRLCSDVDFLVLSSLHYIQALVHTHFRPSV